MTWLHSKVFLKGSLTVFVVCFVVNLFGLLVAMADNGRTCPGGIHTCHSWMAGINHFEQTISPVYSVTFPLLLISIAFVLIALAVRALRQEKNG